MNTKQHGGVGLVVVLIVGAVILVGALAYNGFDLTKEEGREAVRDVVMPNSSSTNGTATSPDGASNNNGASADSEVAFTLKMANLSAEQRAFLKLQGIDGDEIQVTNAMVTCANAKLGSERVTAIKNGAELSMSEKVTLLGCYK